jgi:hypothetical protein
LSVSVRHDVVILACAVSAGIHGALAPAHFGEGAGAGGGFLAAALLLGALVVTLTARPDSQAAVAVAALAFAGLLGSYLLATTTGLPLLHPEPEPVDDLALATKAIEAVGFLAASTILARRAGVAVIPRQAKGTLA